MVKWGLKSVHLSKKFPLEAAYLHRAILSLKKSNTVTHLGQITYFNPFSGNLKWGSKMSNIAYLAKNPTKQKICTDRWIFVHEELDIVTYLLHTTTFDPFWSTLGSNWGQKSKKLAI